MADVLVAANIVLVGVVAVVFIGDVVRNAAEGSILVGVGVREERQELLRGRRDAPGRQFVIHVRRARKRIHQRFSCRGDGAEIAPAYRIIGHYFLIKRAKREAEAFVGPEEKRLVAPIVAMGKIHGATECGPEVVADLLGLGSFAES